MGPEPDIHVLRTLHSISNRLSPFHTLRRSIENVNSVREAVNRLSPDIILSCGSDGIGFNTYHAAISMNRPSLTYLGDTWLTQAWRSLSNYDPWIDIARGGRRPGINRVFKRGLGWIGQVCSGLIRNETPPRFAPVTAISQFVLDDLRSALPPMQHLGDVPFTYVPLDHSFFGADGEPVGHDGSRATAFRAIFVSRVEKLKGPDVALAAVAEAVKYGVNVTLTIAGMQIEAMRPELELLAGSLGIHDRVRFAGTPDTTGLIQLYRSHDVFLFPSRIVEGLGLVNCEAQACGLPIIGTADSGAAEVIQHNETGFRVAINDHEAMANHLGELANDRSLWERLSANALKSAKRFHPETILDTLEAALLTQVQQ